MRFPIRCDPWWVWALALIGALPSTSYVELGPSELVVRLGLFRYRLDRRALVAAGPLTGSWWYGIGIHTDFRGLLIVNGSLAGLVELRLDPPKSTWLLCFPIRVRRLAVSLADPAAFLAALGLPRPA